MDSFIAWIGGKKLLRKKILEQFPLKDEIGQYIEAFGDTRWVFSARKQESTWRFLMTQMET